MKTEILSILAVMMGCKNDDLVRAAEIELKHLQIVENALEVACYDLAHDDCCPYETEGIEFEECKTCPIYNNVYEANQNIERDMNCWKLYFIEHSQKSEREDLNNKKSGDEC